MIKKTSASPAPRSKAERKEAIRTKLDKAQIALYDTNRTEDGIAAAMVCLDSALVDINEDIREDIAAREILDKGTG